MKPSYQYFAVFLVLALLLSGCITAPQNGSSLVPTTTLPSQTVPTSTHSIPCDPTLPSVPVTYPMDPSVPVTHPTEPSVPNTVPTDPSVSDTQPTDPSVPVTEPTAPDQNDPVSVVSISLSASKTTIAVGEELQICYSVYPENAMIQTVFFVSSGGTISDDGVFSAGEPGTYEITAFAMDDSGVTGSIIITVEPAKISSIQISGDSRVMVGDTIQLNATVSPDFAGDPTVTWSIIDGAEFASIDQNGLLTGVAVGKVTVQAMANDGSGVKATHKVEITPILVTQISIHGDSTVKVGKTTQLVAEVKPDNAADQSVKWSISKGSKYASIDQNGVLTALAAGSVTVKAVANDGSGISATFKITVEEAPMWEGSGTKNDPFLIRCLEDLLNLKNVVNKSGYYFRQVADIDCSSVENWIVIGDFDHPFRHHYDGGGYTISNLCLDGDAQALFCVVEGSRFKNMNIVNAHTSDNHRTRENRTDKQPGDGGCTAALVGYGTGCSFENCSAVVDFQSSNHTTGGLLGFVILKNEEYTLMENCHVSGTITSGGYAGGLIGHIWHYMEDDEYSPAHTISVYNCSAEVEIIIFTSSSETPCVGGLIGEGFGVRIEQCYAIGSINVIDGDIGGLVGFAGNYTDVIRCYAKVDIYASTDNHYGGVSIGGLIGHIYSRSDVHDCYATGNITAPYVEWSPCQDDSPRNGGPWRRYYNPCGSLIGTLEVFRAYSEDQKITVYNCYATGTVDVPNICEDERVYCHGALIGLVLDRYTVFNVVGKGKNEPISWDDFSEHYIGHFGNNYNIENLRTYYTPLNDYEGSNLYGMQNPKYAAMPTHDYVEIVGQEQLLDESFFEGWDFENVWIMGENGPELRSASEAASASETAVPPMLTTRVKTEFLEMTVFAQ